MSSNVQHVVYFKGSIYSSFLVLVGFVIESLHFLLDVCKTMIFWKWIVLVFILELDELVVWYFCKIGF